MGSILVGEDPLEEGMAVHSSILAWGIPRTEEPGGLQSTNSWTLLLLAHRLSCFREAGLGTGDQELLC